MIALAAQFSFAAVGCGCVLMRSHDARLLNGLALGFGVGLSALTVGALVLRNGQIFFHFEQIAVRLLGRCFQGLAALNQGAALDARIRELFARRRRLLGSFGWQLAGLVAGSSETWLALRLLGHPVSLTDAMAIESLIQVANSLFFMVPAGVGIQEAGLIGIGHWFGLDAELALTLSIAKRMREIVFGLPALAVWQWIEGRRVALRPAVPAKS
jgi:putative membrane protein